MPATAHGWPAAPGRCDLSPAPMHPMTVGSGADPPRLDAAILDAAPNSAFPWSSRNRSMPSPPDSPITESSPFAPVEDKGRIRQRLLEHALLIRRRQPASSPVICSAGPRRSGRPSCGVHPNRFRRAPGDGAGTHGRPSRNHRHHRPRGRNDSGGRGSDVRPRGTHQRGSHRRQNRLWPRSPTSPLTPSGRSTSVRSRCRAGRPGHRSVRTLLLSSISWRRSGTNPASSPQRLGRDCRNDRLARGAGRCSARKLPRFLRSSLGGSARGGSPLPGPSGRSKTNQMPSGTAQASQNGMTNGNIRDHRAQPSDSAHSGGRGRGGRSCADSSGVMT